MHSFRGALIEKMEKALPVEQSAGHEQLGTQLLLDNLSGTSEYHRPQKDSYRKIHCNSQECIAYRVGHLLP
jgi:hypothetical protein